jgi:mercuric ion binding protein
MKRILMFIVMLGMAVSLQAQSCCSGGEKEKTCCSTDGGKKKSKLSKKSEHASFKVYGNCGMCKKTIEGAIENLKGVQLTDWNMKSGIMRVSFKANRISLDEIKQRIAAAGYDTDSHRAKDEDYSNLHGCCQYERPKS